jgi:hypothetical protein
MVKDNSATAKKQRRVSSYNMFQSYLKRRGTSLNTQDMSTAWTLANRDKKEGDAVTRSSFSTQLNDIRDQLTTERTGADGTVIKTAPDRDDILNEFMKPTNTFGAAFDQEYADYMKQSGRGQQAAAEQARGEYRGTDGKAGSIPKGADPKSDGSAGGPAGLGSLFQKAAATAVGADGMGTFNALTGSFMRGGEQMNAGGGTIDTQTGTDANLGDVITLGPRSTQTGKKTLRPKMPLAGGDAVKGSAMEEGTSNALFEAFSYVPEGYGLGPSNPLHHLNINNEFIRFGVGNLAEPRSMDPANGIKDDLPMWSNDQPVPFIKAQVMDEAKDVVEGASAIAKQEQQPMSIIEDSEDYNAEPSSQALPRPKPTPYETVYNNVRTFLPSTSPAGLFLSNVPYKPADGRTAHRGEL